MIYRFKGIGAVGNRLQKR